MKGSFVKFIMFVLFMCLLSSSYCQDEEVVKKEKPKEVFELKLKDGTSLKYHTIVCNPKKPKFGFRIKGPSGGRIIKFSQVNMKDLPEKMQKTIEDFTKKQNEKNLVLYKDEWNNRNEMLLKTDKRFTYKKLIRRTGNNKFILENKSKGVITIGVRWRGKGYETTAQPNSKSRIVGLHNGEYTFYVAEESEDKKFLNVTKYENIKLNNVIYSLTYGVKGKGKGNEMMKGEFAGQIPIN